MNFNEIINNEALLESINAMGFTKPSQIQEESIPPIREGHDILAQSQTGTGKTAAFAIPLIEKIDREVEGVQVLVICPTRELAVQVSQEFKRLVKFDRDLAVAAVFGGENISKQIRELKKKPQVVVGTPGRLRDHIRRKTVRLDLVNFVVLDEADEMLKMGFADEIQEVYDKIPHKTQNLMFSATIPTKVEKLAGKYLVNPVTIKIEPQSVSSETLKQTYMATQKKHKKDVIKRVLEHKNPSKTIIFCNTKRMVDELLGFMQENGFVADRIHGDLKQEQRTKVLNQFNKGNIDILVATDIAGRGIDIKNVELVINYDMPDEEDSYVHRIGRSGRAGKEGEAISIVSSRDKRMLENIQRYIKKDIEYDKVPSQKTVDNAKLVHLIDDCISKKTTGNKDDYRKILRKIEEEGFTLEDIAISLLEDKLDVSRGGDADYNDYNFFNKGNGGSRNNSGRKGGRSRSKGGNRKYGKGSDRRSSGRSGSKSKGKSDRRNRKSGGDSRRKKNGGSYGKKSGGYSKKRNVA